MTMHMPTIVRTWRTGTWNRSKTKSVLFLVICLTVVLGCKPPPPAQSGATASIAGSGSPAAPTPTTGASAAAPGSQPRGAKNAAPTLSPQAPFDPAYQIDPKTLSVITQKVAQSPLRPLPGKADASKSFTLWQAKTEVWRKVFLEGYRAQNRGDAAQQAQAEKFLEGYCLRIGDAPNQPPIGDLVDAGRALFEAQLNDPFVYLAFAAVLSDSGMRNSPLFADVLKSLDGLYRDGQQSPWLTARYYRMLVNRAGGSGTSSSLADSDREHLRLAAENLMRASADRSLANSQRQMCVWLLDGWADQYPAGLFLDVVTARLKESSDVDGWVRDVLLARHYVKSAWQIRGTGLGNTISAATWRGFEAEMAKARFHAVRAWESHPELPEAACEMITITMAGSGIEHVGTRFWFDEAVQADFLSFSAYSNYAWALRPRWGGSHEQMLALARECLDTERFDTEVPNFFHQIVSDVVREQGSWEGVLREPAVYEGYVHLFEYHAQHANDEIARNHQRSMLAAVAWAAGKRAQARKIINSLGDQGDPAAFELFGHSLAEVRQRLEAMLARPGDFSQPEGSVTVLAFLNDGQQLVLGSDHGEITVWNVSSRQRQHVLNEHAAEVTACVVSRDGQQLISASKDGKINFWNVSDWKLTDTMDVPPPLHAIAVSVDGSRLVASHGTGAELELAVFEVTTKKPLETLSVAGPPIWPLAFDSPGRRIFFSPQPAPGKDKLFMWNIGDRSAQAHNGQIPQSMTAWQASPDGQKLAVGVTGRDNVLGKVKTVSLLALIDANSGAVLAALKHVPGRVRSIAYFPDGERVAATTENGALVVWKPGGDNVSSCIRTGFDGLSTLALAPGASQAAALDSDGQVHLFPLKAETAGWEIETPLLETRLRDFVRGLSNTPDGKYLIVDAPLGELSLWDWESGLRKCKHAFHFPTVTYSVALFPDQKRVLCEVGAGSVAVNRILDTTSGATLDSPPRSSCSAVSPTGNYFALAGDGISLLAADDYHPFPWGKLAGDKDIWHLAFSGDGTAIVSSNRFGSLKWYDLPAQPEVNSTTPTYRPTFVINRPPPFSLAISPDKTMVASGRETVDILDSQTGKPLCSVPGKWAAFSPDSQRIVVAAAPNAINSAAIYEVRTGRLLTKLRGGHRAEITAVVFSPDGRVVLTADQEGIVLAWDAHSGQALRELSSSASQ